MIANSKFLGRVAAGGLLVTILLLGTPLTRAQSSGTLNYYVSTTGSDTTGTGSSTSPWATIAHASTQVGPGAVVHVAAGVYSGSFTTSTSGTSSAPITYVSETKWGAQLVGTSGSTWTNDGDYVVIENFDVTGPGLNGIYTQGNATQIIGNRVHNILSTTCNSTGGSGINLNGTNAEVIGNEVYDNGPYPTACGYVPGIYFLQAGGYAWNNIVFDNAGFGIQLWHTPSNNAIVNNTVFGNASGGIVLGTDNAGFTVDYVTVNNNIVYKNAGIGIAEEGASSSSTGTHNVYMDNLVYGNSGASFSLQNGNVDSGTVSANPDFVNYTGDATGNYQLQSVSPAINVGTSDNAPPYDYDNAPRPQGSAWDVGAYEYGATASASVTPNSLSFASQIVGTSSTAQSITFTNTSGSSVSVNGISITGTDSGDFAQTNNCGSSVAAGGNCTIGVTFTPTVVGSLTATLTVSDSSSGSPQTVGLSGTGGSSTGPVVDLSPVSLAFASQTVGTTSATQFVTLTNGGNSTLTFSSSFAISGDFAFAGVGTCGSSVAAGASCTISVDFSPTTTGTRTGAVTLSDNASDSPQTIPLTGSGISSGSTAPSVSLTPSSLSFGNQKIGTTSSAQTIVLTNTGGSTLTIAAIQTTGPFAETNSCGGSVAAGADCSIHVTFTPTGHGSASGTLSVNDNASGSPQSVPLSGSGTGRWLAMTATPSTASVSPGGAASYTVSITSGDGSSVDSAVTLTCSGLPPSTPCAFTPASVTPGSGTSVSTLTISTSSAVVVNQRWTQPDSRIPLLALWAMLLLATASFAASTLKATKPWAMRAGPCALLLCLCAPVVGCGGGASQAAMPAGSYSITVSAMSALAQGSTQVGLTVK